ncbi:MAG: hypothetical protein OXU20_28545 [Myxococcales bacterium]|nr:hypothetical protein [Myxococcales bacterium]
MMNDALVAVRPVRMLYRGLLVIACTMTACFADQATPAPTPSPAGSARGSTAVEPANGPAQTVELTTAEYEAMQQLNADLGRLARALDESVAAAELSQELTTLWADHGHGVRSVGLAAVDDQASGMVRVALSDMLQFGENVEVFGPIVMELETTPNLPAGVASVMNDIERTATVLMSGSVEAPPELVDKGPRKRFCCVISGGFAGKDCKGMKVFPRLAAARCSTRFAALLGAFPPGSFLTWDARRGRCRDVCTL